MRKRHEANLTVNELVEYINEGKLDFDYPVQRPHNQWKLIDKSLLIHSILVDYDIPAIYSVDGVGNDKMYSVIDGKQRSTVLADYLNDGFELHLDTPKAIHKGTEYDVAQLKFSELDEPLQNAIRNYSLRMIYFVNITNDEIFEMFFRLNNGRQLSKQQKVKSKMGIDIALFMKELSENEFINSKIVLTDNQRNNSEYETVLTQAMMLIDNEYQLKSFSARDIEGYTQILKEKDVSYLDKIRATVEYLNQVYKGAESGVELKKVNAPILIAVASKVGAELSPEKFYEWTGYFANEIQKEESPYQEFVGKSTTNKGKVEGRYAFMLNHAREFIGATTETSTV